MELKDISPFRDFFEPIGALVLASSMLETHITSTIRNLLNVSGEDIVAITEKIRSIEHRIDIFEVLSRGRIKYPNNTNLDHWLKDITCDLRNAVKHRNHIIHGPWNDFDPITDAATKLRFRSKKAYEVKKYAYTPNEVTTIASLMLVVMGRMGFFMGYLSHQDDPNGAPPPSPGRCLPKCPP